MTVIFYSLLLLLGIYAFLSGWLSLGFSRTDTFNISESEVFSPLTIIICARNEEKKIGRCLNTILQQDYDLSKIQIIIVNDASTDTTAFQAESVLNKSTVEYKIITNALQKGKKQCITNAMQFAKNELIITRDADTFTRSFSWLKSISDFQRLHPSDLIIGPVAIADNVGILWALQAIENNILNVLNAGSAFYKKPFLCSGANLIFTKTIFAKTNGYSSHADISSGDDILFMEDVKKINSSLINYIKCSDSIVYTYPCYSFQSLVNQKSRWASKFKVNTNPLNLVLAALSFMVNASWLFCLLYGFFVPQKEELSLIFVFLKLLIDILLLFLASRFLKNKAIAWYVLPVGCIYPIYAVIIAIAATFVKPKWK
ncbi:MAG: hypothetical protein JWO32_2188 [Bacteroidetes bacterium]|nr:hypothetical protein [Bacteroidota bacterium]